MLDDLPNHFIGEIYHVDEVALWIILVPFVGCRTKSLRIPIGGIGCGVKRTMGKDHRIVDKEGLFFIFVDKVTNEIGTDLGPVFP